ncbi:outer membrane immunogenic protein [Aminobacter aminovorans]|uniref:Opacity protein and related surface antigens n=1 Tax=Aminobacter aminovorans TaxID=83263 RepID=A0A380WR68_AMIAI|nr:outer membrane protein [Aminobacter aminovorans]TCS29957.1 outer membrane immunogenic protein [Aminobacter aminovorans]SUU90806.1 Opacity protein and related surface antigens [Aminobacter aminovorans]
MNKLLLINLFLLGLSGIASAADAVVLEPSPEILPAGFVWTGGYVGLQAGYGWGDGDLSSDVPAAAPAEIDGWSGGFYAGYNHQLANDVVLGIDADIAWSGIDGIGQLSVLGFPVPGAGIDYELNWTGAVRARLGYAVDRFLPYIAGGVAFAGADATLLGNGTPFQEFSDTLVGWTLGVGVEYAFTDTLLARAEYRYTDYGDLDFSGLGGATGRFGFKTSDVRVGLAYKF